MTGPAMSTMPAIRYLLISLDVKKVVEQLQRLGPLGLGQVAQASLENCIALRLELLSARQLGSRIHQGPVGLLVEAHQRNLKYDFCTIWDSLRTFMIGFLYNCSVVLQYLAMMQALPGQALQGECSPESYP